MNTQTIKLDVTKRPTVAPVVNIGQGDKSGTILKAEIYDDGIPFTLTGYSVKFAMRSPHGAGYYECNGTVAGNVATFTIDETYAATVSGVTDVAYVEVISGTTIICSTNRFRINVLESATENTDPNGAYTNGVARFLSQADSQLRTMLNQSEAELEDAIEDAAEAISETDAAVARANTAAEAAEGVVLQSMPTMSAGVKGGAKLGSGLTIDSDTLSLGNLTDSGNPVDGCAIAELDGEGWSEQVSTTGKNLMPRLTTGTNNDVLFTVHDDGSISATGTAGSVNASKGSSVTLPAGMYTFSIGAVDSAVANGYVSVGVDIIARNTGTPGPTFTLSEETEVRAMVRIIAGKTADGTTFYPMLEAGSTATSYEPYSGGVPGPNPSHPFPIEVCRGRNLLPGLNGTKTSANVTATGDGSGTITFSGTTNGVAWLVLTSAKLEAGTTYTLSKTRVFKGSVSIWDNVQSTSAFTLPINDLSKTFTPTHDGIYTICASIDSGVNMNGETVAFQLELGSTPSPYVPYGHVGLEMRKELWNAVEYPRTANKYIKYGDGSDATASGGWKSPVGYMTIPPELIDGIIISSFGDIGGSLPGYAFYDSSKTYISGGKNFPAIIPENAAYFRCSMTDTLADSDVSLVAVSTVPIPLPLKSDGTRWAGGLPDGTADALTVDSAGKWEWVNVCEGYTVTGYENVADTGQIDDVRRICLVGVLPASGGTNNFIGLCSHAPFKGAWNIGEIHVFTNVSNVYLFDIATTDAEVLTAYIGANVLYKLATPTTESGYVALPLLPNGCTVSCPELAEVGIEWVVEGMRPIMEHIANERKYIEALIAEIATS